MKKCQFQNKDQNHKNTTSYFRQNNNFWQNFFQQQSQFSPPLQKENLLNFVWNCKQEKQQLKKIQQNHKAIRQFTVEDSQIKERQQSVLEKQHFQHLKNCNSLINSKRKSQNLQKKSKALRLFIKSKLNFQKIYNQKLELNQQKQQQQNEDYKDKGLKNICTLKEQLIFSRYNMYQRKSKFVLIQKYQKKNLKINSKHSMKNNSIFANANLKSDQSKFNLFQNQLYSSIKVKSCCPTEKQTKKDNQKNQIVTKIYGQKKRKTKGNILNKVKKSQNYLIKLQNQENTILKRNSETTSQIITKNVPKKPNILVKRDSTSQNFKQRNQLILNRKKQEKNSFIMKSQVLKQQKRGKSVQCERKSIQKIITQNYPKQNLKTEQNVKQLKQSKQNSQAPNQSIIKPNILQRKKDKNYLNSQWKMQKNQQNSKFKFEKQTKEFYQSMERFNIKFGNNANTNLLIFDSRDNLYIVKNLINNNWKINKKVNSEYFILKWVYLPSSMDLKHLKNGQFYNHFRNIHQITSKTYLSKNLTANTHRFRNITNFFPKSFDIGKKCQFYQFIQQYRQQIVLILLKRLILVCFQNQPNITKKLFKEFSQKDLEQLIEQSQFEAVLENKNFNVLEFQNFKQKNNQFILYINLVIIVLKFCRNLRKNNLLDHNNSFNFLTFSQQDFLNNYQLLQVYYQQESLTTPIAQKKLLKQFYSTPSELLINLIVKQFVYFNKIKNWSIGQQNLKKAEFNNQNIWIIKPGSNARGNGIYLQKNLNLILNSVKGIQSRIVQKYIQRPLILKYSSNEYLNNKKFDLRQWVLIKSLDPLQIYMFSHCYIRLCSQNYDLTNIKNCKSHLTNYSLNKEGFSNKQKSVIGIQKFKLYLKEEFKIDWDQKIRPKIKQIIIQSILSCQQKIESSDEGTCFQLLGYDILIDQKFNPWLIQVNMSPACQQRTEQLKQYIQAMNTQLLCLVLPHHYIPHIQLQQKRKYRWQKIFQQNYQFTKKDTDLKLQIIGYNPFQSKNKSNQFRETKICSFQNLCKKSQSQKIENDIKLKEYNNFGEQVFQKQQQIEEFTDKMEMLQQCILEQSLQGYKVQDKVSEIQPYFQQNKQEKNNFIEEGLYITQEQLKVYQRENEQLQLIQDK